MNLQNFIVITPHENMMIQYQDTFPFLKENSPKNRMLCLHNVWGTFKKFSWLCYICKSKTESF